VSPSLIDLLENYSGIPRDEQEQHLLHVVLSIPSSSSQRKTANHKQRDVAWEIFPFPCFGLFWWLVLGLSTHPHYSGRLSHLKTPHSSPTKFLDLGTCLGQDARKLIHDGIHPSSVYGSDLFPAYENAGFSLFKDE
jgi:hypothetical protein